MISAVYRNRILYYDMMREYLDKKVTALEFKRKYFDRHTENEEYPCPYFYVLKTKLSNKNLFEEKNLSLLCDIEEKINAIEFSNRYCKQRNKDLDENKASGYSDYYRNRVLVGNEKIFEENYSWLLYDKGSEALKEYERGLKELDIKGEIFFDDIYNFIDIYIMEYTPSDAEYFNPETDTDEKILRRITQLAFDILERNLRQDR